MRRRWLRSGRRSLGSRAWVGARVVWDLGEGGLDLGEGRFGPGEGRLERLAPDLHPEGPPMHERWRSSSTP